MLKSFQWMRYGRGSRFWFALLCYLSAIRGFANAPLHNHDATGLQYHLAISDTVHTVALNTHQHCQPSLAYHEFDDDEEDASSVESDDENDGPHHSHCPHPDKHCHLECTNNCCPHILTSTVVDTVLSISCWQVADMTSIRFEDGFPQVKLDPPRHA